MENTNTSIDNQTTLEENESLEVNPLDMPDDEFDKLPLPTEEPVVEDSNEEKEDNEDTTENTEFSEEESSKDNDSNEENSEENEVSDVESQEDDNTSDNSAEEESDTEEKDETLETDGKDKETKDIDYKAEYNKIKSEYDKLFAPFKANGRTIKIDSVDEAITLMQMGANYAKKMSAIKPNLKILKTLENNGLLDPEKINYLIDLAQKKPEAISKLVKEANIDPLDLDTSKADDYKTSNHIVSDSEVELEQTIEEVKNSPTFERTIAVVTEELDEPSKAIIATEPSLIKVLDQHIQSGIYDTIMNAVTKARALGELSGVSDLEAYKIIGDKLHAEGKLVPTQTTSTNNQTTQTQAQQTSTKKVDRKKVEKKKAAGITKTKPVKKQTDFNPLALSDEEFEKLEKTQKFI